MHGETMKIYQDNLCIGEYSNGGHTVWANLLGAKEF